MSTGKYLCCSSPLTYLLLQSIPRLLAHVLRHLLAVRSVGTGGSTRAWASQSHPLGGGWPRLLRLLQLYLLLQELLLLLQLLHLVENVLVLVVLAVDLELPVEPDLWGVSRSRDDRSRKLDFLAVGQ